MPTVTPARSNLYETLAPVILAGLEQYREDASKRVMVPGSLDPDGPSNFAYLHQLWLSKIDSMIAAFSLIVAESRLPEDQPTIDKGLAAFAEHYLDLWL